VQVALRGDPGISKSQIVRELLADAILTVRKASNDRPVPNHRGDIPTGTLS
jgi:hypothetical protein